MSSVFFNLPFVSSYMLFGTSFGFYISQLIRYARCYTYYDDFGFYHKLPVDRLLSQRYKVNGLTNSFQKFYGRCLDLLSQ